MGCQTSRAMGNKATKDTVQENEANSGAQHLTNSRLSDVAVALPDDHEDPNNPLNKRQIFLLKKNWKGIKRSMEDTGVEMFIRMFRKKSELLTLFNDFKTLQMDDSVRDNEFLEAHASLVMIALDDLISDMHDADLVRKNCSKLAESHLRFPGFTPDLFWNIQTPFLEAVKITLGDRYTEKMETIYRITINFIISNISSALAAHLELANNDHGLIKNTTGSIGVKDA